jgi:hypothetical protein
MPSPDSPGDAFIALRVPAGSYWIEAADPLKIKIRADPLAPSAPRPHPLPYPSSLPEPAIQDKENLEKEEGSFCGIRCVGVPPYLPVWNSCEEIPQPS